MVNVKSFERDLKFGWALKERYILAGRKHARKPVMQVITLRLMAKHFH